MGVDELDKLEFNRFNADWMHWLQLPPYDVEFIFI